MRNLCLLICVFIFNPLWAQDKKENKKRRSLGEMTSNLTGKLLTGSTDNLAAATLDIGLISGAYDMRTKTSSIKYYPEGTEEGDYIVYVSFKKSSGMGLLKIKGEVLCDGEAMDYVGLGAYVKVYKTPFNSAKTVSIKTETGDSARIVLKPIPPVELKTVNGESMLPIIDLAEDLSFEYDKVVNDSNLIMRAGMLFDVMGVTEFNYFADFAQKNTKVTIPKEALSNTQVSGQFNVGQFNKGENFFLLERVQRIPLIKLSTTENYIGNLADVNVSNYAYSTMPVVVKGKQEEGIIVRIDFAGKTPDGKIAFNIAKPNAQSGIPFSKGSKFGLASLSLQGKLYDKEVKNYSSSYSIGTTRFTKTTTVTTIKQFPQLPDGHWDAVLDEFYKQLTTVFKQKFNIEFVDVASITATPSYSQVFKQNEVNTNVKIARSYKNTRRCNPSDLRELMDKKVDPKSTEPTGTSFMEQLAIDGLLSLDVSFDIGANSDKKVVLMPTVTFSIVGIDETKLNKKGTYASGRITFTDGIPFNEQTLKADPKALVKVCNVDKIAACMEYMLVNLQRKEKELGFDKIWSIGE